MKLLTTNIIINIHDREVHVSAKSKLDCGKSKIISPVLKQSTIPPSVLVTDSTFYLKQVCVTVLLADEVKTSKQSYI